MPSQVLAILIGMRVRGVPRQNRHARLMVESIARVRLVLMLVNSIGKRTDTSGVTIVALIRKSPLIYLLASATP